MLALRTQKTHQWNVTHTIYNYPLVFWGVLSYATEMCFCYMIAIEKGHLSVGLYPYLE